MKFANHLPDQLERFWQEEAGVSLIECALVGFLIVVFCLLLLLALDKDA
ncbi:MAG: hypothetical protein JWQ03_3043 [Variovorax sp.]|nr:hypothetical protein [Variovorax sp.]